ncbi:MAG: helix-turn-helix domain-containing protein [Dehalococcoidia bacterium]
MAQELRVREDTVRRWIRQGKLAAKFIGGRSGYRISGDELLKFLGESDYDARTSSRGGRPE